MTRLPDWETRLSEMLKTEMLKTADPFRYGRTDCALFAGRAIKAVTGIPLAGRFAGRYEDRRSARALIRKHGRNLLEATRAVLGELGAMEVPVLTARRGDVVGARHDGGGWFLGVVSMDGWRVFHPTPAGLHWITLKRCAVAWRIG